jgi:hypothetical protein
MRGGAGVRTSGLRPLHGAIAGVLMLLSSSGTSVAADPTLGAIVFRNRCRVNTRVTVHAGYYGATLLEAVVSPRRRVKVEVPRYQEYTVDIDWNADGEVDTGRDFTLGRRSTCRLAYDMGFPYNELWRDR